MLKTEDNEELQSLSIASLSLNFAFQPPSLEVAYYIQMGNGTVHGPCAIKGQKLSGAVHQAALVFGDAIERNLIEYALGEGVKVVPTGIASSKEF